MTLPDFNVAQTLKAFPNLTVAYQGKPSNVPVLLAPGGPAPRAPGATLAVLAPVQLGSRVVLAIPIVTQLIQQSAGPQGYRYLPVWRVQSAAAPAPEEQTSRVQGHGSPQLSTALPGPPLPVTEAFLGQTELVPPPYVGPLPLQPDGVSPMPLQQGGGVSTFGIGWAVFELTALGDELGLLVVRESQPFQAAPVSTWDFALGGLDASFAAVYGNPALPPANYNLGLGVTLLAGTRSP